MKIVLDIRKAAANRGEERLGSYIRRVATGKKDKDGSPQYRYLRTKEEVDAYERKHGKKDKEEKDTKVTHEKQQEEHKKIKEKTDKDKKPSLLVKEKVKKALYVRG